MAEEPSDEWECPRCGARAADDYSLCRACGFERPLAADPDFAETKSKSVLRAAGAISSAAKSSSAGEWIEGIAKMIGLAIVAAIAWAALHLLVSALRWMWEHPLF